MISQRKIEHDVRLKEGEVSVLGGLIERTETNNQNGIPGLSQNPLTKYLFSENSKEVQDNEVLIVLTPHIIRLPSITAANLRTMAAGTDSDRARVSRRCGRPAGGSAPAFEIKSRAPQCSASSWAARSTASF